MDFNSHGRDIRDWMAEILRRVGPDHQPKIHRGVYQDDIGHRHQLRQVIGAPAPCGDIAVLLDCSCGRVLGGAVCYGGCGVHHSPQGPEIEEWDPFHRAMFLMDSRCPHDPVIDLDALGRQGWMQN